jgi:hypothetical protein
MLVAEEQECTNLRKMLAMMTSQLREETQRADDADRRARDVVVRFKGAMEAKLVVEQDAARVNEELRLYKIQLENAQKEIYKAQSVLNDVDSQRVEAEEAAARARDTARKLKEQRLIDIAREEGRRMGIKEGLARGQDVGYRQGRAAAYARGRVVSPHEGGTLEELDDDDYYDGGNSTSTGPSRPPSPPKSATPTSSRSRSTHKSRPTNYSDPVDNIPAPVPTTNTATAAPLPMPPPPPPVIQVESPPPPIVRPVQTRRTMPSPTSQLHSKVSIPPDGWIPTLDEGGTIRIPPPHEFSPQPSPSTTVPPPLPRPVEEEEPPLMMRPPLTDPHVSDRESVASASPRQRPRNVRRRSSDSATSTTISQLDIINPPNVRPVQQARERTLSAIAEERSSATPSPNPSYVQVCVFVVNLSKCSCSAVTTYQSAPEIPFGRHPTPSRGNACT